MSIEPMCNCFGSSIEAVRAVTTCQCGFVVNQLEWHWEMQTYSSAVRVMPEGRTVTFHQRFSSGTAVVRGDTPLRPGHHYYWEIRMLSMLYGTDTMVGVGTKNVILNTAMYNFSSFLGLDAESWGFSYSGKVQHAGKFGIYGPSYSRGVVVGVHLDMWHGTIEFYLDRKPLGIAFRGLRTHEELYPMVSSTAAQSSVRLEYAVSRPASLMLGCCKVLAQRPHIVDELRAVPGFRQLFINEFWLLLPSTADSNDSDTEEEGLYTYQANTEISTRKCTYNRARMANYTQRPSFYHHFPRNSERIPRRNIDIDDDDGINSPVSKTPEEKTCDIYENLIEPDSPTEVTVSLPMLMPPTLASSSSGPSHVPLNAACKQPS